MSKEIDKIKRKAIEMFMNKEFIEKDTALDTVRANIPTIDEMAGLSFTFDRDNFDISQQYLISKTIVLLEYLAEKIDNLAK